MGKEYAGKAVKDTARTAQCAVTGETEPIARIHSKIKGVYGGLATGSVLIGLTMIQKTPMEMNSLITVTFLRLR